MKFRWLSLLPLTLLLGSCLQAADRFDPKTMLDASQVRHGDIAIGKSVFAGTKITEFRLEIIDVMKQANLGQDMILARVLDGPVVLRQSGIIGGMSGSPVYLDGKLLGAIAWGWGYQKEPIAGITPIRPMLEALDLLESKQAELPRPGTQWLAQRPFTIAGQTFRGVQTARGETRVAQGFMPLRTVSTPITCSGLGAETLRVLGGKLRDRGLELQAGSGQRADCVPVEIEPGAAVGVRFMGGDFDMTGIGTVTYRTGDQIVAFGHPLMQLGAVRLPMTTAWINDFMPSYQRSNKMGCGMADIGVLGADTPYAIGGSIGPKAPLIPARLEVFDRTRDRRRTYTVSVLDHPGLTPQVLGMGVASALEASFNPGAEGVIRTHFELRGKNGARVSRDNQYYIAGSPVEIGVGEVSAFMDLLETNRWQPQGIAEMVFRAELTDRDETAALERVYTEETVARAGKPLHLHVALRPDGGTLQDEVFTLQMPWDLPKGTLRLGIGGGADAMLLRSRLGAMIPDFDNLDGLLQYAEGMEQNQDLCVIAALPTTGVAVGATRLMQIPPVLSAVLEKSTRTDLDQGKDEMLLTRRLPYVLFGRHVLTLATEDRMGARGTVSASSKPAAETKPKETDSDEPSKASAGFWWAQSAFKAGSTVRERTREAAPEPWDAAADRVPARPAAAVRDAAPDEDDDAADADETADTADKPVLRQPATWKQAKLSDFSAGEAQGLALLSDGGLAAEPGLQTVERLTEGYIFGALQQGSTTILATAAPACLYKLTDGKPVRLCDLQAFGARALAADDSGNVFVGTWPGGRIMRVAPDGRCTLFATLPCDYVWALAFDRQNRLLAGTGPGGRLYGLDSAGKFEELAQLPQAHVFSLALMGDDLYLGSSNRGLVYRLEPGRRLTTVLSTDDDDVTALLPAEGSLYVGTSGGKVYRLQDDKATLRFEDKESPIHALALCDKTLYAATGDEGKLLAITGEKTHRVVYDALATDLLALAASPQGLIIGGGNAAEVLRLDAMKPAEGNYTSAVFDAKRSARWGFLTWQAAGAPGQVVIQTRSGQSSNPDDGSWSGWSVAASDCNGERISSPAGRYLQYRVQMKWQQDQPAPVLQWLSLSYLPANQKPKVELTEPGSGDVKHGEFEITWTASDPDEDSLQATLEYRPAGGDKWETIRRLPADKKSYEWATGSVADGTYDLRLTVSDERSNPDAALSDSVTVYALRLDNTKPELQGVRTTEKDGMLQVEGIAFDKQRVVEVAYQVDEEWYSARAEDGVFDSQYEQFSLTVPLAGGKAKLTLRCRDMAGNVECREITWPAGPESQSNRIQRP